MISKLDGFKMCTDISSRYPSKQVFQFINESGNSVYVAWETNTKEDASKLDLIKGEVKVTDILGKDTNTKGDSIVITTVPVYIEKII